MKLFILFRHVKNGQLLYGGIFNNKDMAEKIVKRENDKLKNENSKDFYNYIIVNECDINDDFLGLM